MGTNDSRRVDAAQQDGEAPRPTGVQGTNAGESDEDQALVAAAKLGDSAAWETLAGRYGPRLRRMIGARLDPRLRRRVGVSDVLQEVLLAAATSLAQYRPQPGLSLYAWIRGVARNKLLIVHRRHLGAEQRDARRELPAVGPQASSVNLAELLVTTDPRPSTMLRRDERKQALIAALDLLHPLDREVLALRHFEQLSNREAAETLGIEPAAASKRYRRALVRLAGKLNVD